MYVIAAQLISLNSPAVALTALIVCAVMAVIAVLVLGQTECAQRRYMRMGTLAGVVGIGVWATHFVSILGYRRDLVLGYDDVTTLLSALTAIGLVGGPLAATMIVRRCWQRVFLGAVAGAGVGVMHLVGMSALQGCGVTQSPLATTIAFVLGILGFSGAVAVARIRAARFLAVTLIILGVCSLHFVALAGTMIERAPRTESWIMHPFMLAGFVAFASLALYATALIMARASARLDEKARTAQREEERHFAVLSAALGNMSNGLVMFGPDARITLFNDRARELLRLEQDGLAIGMSMATYVANIATRNRWDEATTARVFARRMEVISDFVSSRIEQEYTDGTILSIGCQPMPGGGAVLTYDDITRQRAAEAELAQQYGVLSTALRHMSNGLMMVGQDGRIGLFNDRARELLRLDEGEISVGMSMATLIANTGKRNGWDEAKIDNILERRMEVIRNLATSRVEQEYSDGKTLSIGCQPLPGGGAILTFDDITERRAAQAELAHFAYHDALTGMPNRRAFREQLEKALGRYKTVTLLLLDLDRFKLVNDTLGHPAGDRLLVEVAARLREKCRQTDLIYRLGGDEFAIMQGDLSVQVAEDLANRVIADLGIPFLIDGNTISIGCSVGLASSAVGDGHEQLVQQADLALYRAKDLGRNRVEQYEQGMIETAQAHRQLELDLARALTENEFELYYQPICSLPARRLAGFEALIRWNHPSQGRVPPGDFIPLSEKCGMIAEIGAWVLDEACRQAARWPAHLHVAVNVSPVQMRSGKMVGLVTEALARHGVAATRLELELTETAMVEDGPRIAATLRELRNLGVRIAMDDFGTGYSSLAHLRDFEVDCIKIDRSFIDTPMDDDGAWAVVRAVTGLARDMSIVTVAEGVETPEQLARLMQIGCDCAQGYLLGRPMNAKAATTLIEIQAFEDDAFDDRTEVRHTGS